MTMLLLMIIIITELLRIAGLRRLMDPILLIIGSELCSSPFFFMVNECLECHSLKLAVYKSNGQKQLVV